MEATDFFKQFMNEMQYVAELYKDDYLLGILRKYNLVENEELLKELKIYIIDLESVEDDEESMKFKRKWISMGDDELFETKNLSRVTKYKEYNDGKFNYYLILNETPNVDFALQNIKVKYKSEAERDADFVIIKRKLEGLDVFFK